MPEERCAGNVGSDRHSGAPADGANDPVCADDADIAIALNVDRVVEPRQIGWIERGDDHAAERPVGILHAARELDRPLARDPPDDRLADEQVIALRASVNAKVLAVAQVELPR